MVNLLQFSAQNNIPRVSLELSPGHPSLWAGAIIAVLWHWCTAFYSSFATFKGPLTVCPTLFTHPALPPFLETCDYYSRWSTSYATAKPWEGDGASMDPRCSMPQVDFALSLNLAPCEVGLVVSWPLWDNPLSCSTTDLSTQLIYVWNGLNRNFWVQTLNGFIAF